MEIFLKWGYVCYILTIFCTVREHVQYMFIKQARTQGEGEAVL